MKNDAIEEGKEISLPSFDIAAIMYNANMANLSGNSIFELSVVAETQRFLDELYHNPDRAKSLMVPDGSRKIFDTDSKYQGLKILSVEMDDLAREIAREQDYMLRLLSDLSLSDSRSALAKAYIQA